MSKITPEAKDRISKKSLPEQLEDVRRQMQRESGSQDMRTIDAHLEADNWNKQFAHFVADNWQTRVRHVPEPVFGNINPDIGNPISAMRIDGAD